MFFIHPFPTSWYFPCLRGRVCWRDERMRGERLVFRFSFSVFSSNQVCDALPEGVCPVGDVQAEGFLYLGLVQDGVGGALDGRGVLAAEAGTDVALALLRAEGVGGVLYHLGEVVPGADAEVGVVVDAGFGVEGGSER